VATLDGLAAARRGWQPHGAVAELVAAVVLLGAGSTALSLGSARGRRFWAARLFRCWTLGLSVLLAMAGCEFVLRRLDSNRLFPRRQAGHVYEFEPDVALFPGVAPVARHGINSRGWRAAECPTGEGIHRVLCVGGESTECLYLDDANTWPAQLMRKLNEKPPRNWVANAGLSGDGVAQHWNRLRHGNPLRDIDCVVVLVGGDDLMRALLQLDKRPTPVLHALLCMQLLYGPAGTTPHVLADRTGVELSAAREGLDTKIEGVDIGRSLARFAAYVRQLVELARRRGVRIVFVTQPVLWDDLLPGLGARRLRLMRSYFEAGADELSPPKMDQVVALSISDHFNKRLTQTCRELEVECFDAALRMNGRTPYFYDDMHLNDAGCAELARLLADFLRAKPNQEQRPPGETAPPQ
jgi:lysophospholipase L1-like esterase